MRQVFSSLRLENVEGVAALLNEHGIETYISQPRSYKGNRRRTFSYSDGAKDNTPAAAVWVVHAEDQPKARALLREAGLMETTRDSYLPENATTAPVVRGPVNHAARIRMVMLAAVVVLATFTSARQCHSPGNVAPAPQPPPPAQTPEDDPERHIVPVDTSLR